MSALSLVQPETLGDGPRPMRLPADRRVVTDLVRTIFSHGAYGDLAGAGLGQPILRRRVADRLRLQPGFIWQEGGNIVGSVSLLGTWMRNDYLIANMAVLTGHRRQGIGRALLLEVLSHVSGVGGGQVRLLVDVTNEPALQLYRSAGFKDLYKSTIWSQSLSRIRRSDDKLSRPVKVRRLGADEAGLAANISSSFRIPDTEWPEPRTVRDFRTGFAARATDYLAGRYREHWLAIEAGAKNAIGLGSVDISPLGNCDLDIRIRSNREGDCETELLQRLIESARERRVRRVHINVPANSGVLRNAVDRRGMIAEGEKVLMVRQVETR